MTESPSKLAISKENLTRPATVSELNRVAEQVNILVGCYEANTRKLDTLTKILKAVAEKLGVSTDVLDDGPDDGPDVEDLTGSIDALVQQVLRRGGCPFRCLGLERGASQEGVRKRYLALALRLHPDKAQHPQADEAFAALEGAYSRAKDAAAAAAAAS